MKKLLVVLVAVIALGLGSYFAYLRYRFVTVETARASYVTVETARASYAPIKEVVSEEGIAKAVKDINLSSEIQAKVKKLAVKEGDVVKKGQLLVELDGEVLQSQLEQSKAELNVQKGRLAELEVEIEHLRKTCERCKQLVADGTISRQYYDDQKAKLDTAEKRFITARAELERVKKSIEVQEVQLSKTKIYCPINGSVIKIETEEGEIAVPGRAIMKIVDDSEIRIEAEIAEADIGKVYPGQKVFVSADSAPDKFFEGTLARIDPLALPKGEIIEVTRAAEEKVFRGIIQLDEKNPPFQPGMSIYVDFLTAFKEKALTIPAQALFSESKNTYVYTIKEGRAVKTRVKTGLRDILVIEIVEGLNEGDEVITSDLTKVKPGLRIKVRNEQE